MQSTIAQSIDTTDSRAQYDECVKKLLAEVIVLAWILKECVEEFKPYSIEQIMNECIMGDITVSAYAVDQDVPDRDEGTPSQLDGQNTEDSSVNEGTIYYDIRFTAVVPGTDEPVQLIINVEAQKNRTAYPLIKRVIYYLARLVSAQKNKVFTGSHYEKIHKVYTIWIQMNASEDKANTITSYQFTEHTIVGNAHEAKENYDLMTAIMIGLGSSSSTVEQPILRLLNTLLSTESKPEDKKKVLENDFNIPMSVSMSEEVDEMCNLGQGLVEMTEIKTTANIIIRMMNKNHYSLDEALDKADVPDEDREYVMDFINKALAVSPQ